MKYKSNAYSQWTQLKCMYRFYGVLSRMPINYSAHVMAYEESFQIYERAYKNNMRSF